jgi:HAD superfamily hydrolase (TIGR01509 family)
MTPMQYNDNKKINCVIYDFDGVIVDTERIRYNFLNEILRLYNVNNFKERFAIKELVGFSTKRFLEIYFPQFSEIVIHKILSERHEYFYKEFKKKNILYPGAITTIKYLNKLCKELVIATTNESHVVNKILAEYQLGKYFNQVFAKDKILNIENDLKDYRKVLRLIGKESDECIVIEDSQLGVTSAKEASLYCVAFNRFNNRVIEENADKVISNHEELRIVLEKIFSNSN